MTKELPLVIDKDICLFIEKYIGQFPRPTIREMCAESQRNADQLVLNEARAEVAKEILGKLEPLAEHGSKIAWRIEKLKAEYVKP